MNKNQAGGWIDVSVPLFPGMVHWPGDPPFQAELAQGLARGDICNVTAVSTSVHIGTHMDAPRHFIPGAPGMEALPLDAVIGPCRVIEITDPQAIRPAELEPHHFQRGERILFKTRNSAGAWKNNAFLESFVYVSKEAAQFLADRGVRTVGVDYLSVGGFFKDGLETHQILLGAGVWIIEGLDLAQSQPGAHELICLPLKIMGSDGAPARAVLRPL